MRILVKTTIRNIIGKPFRSVLVIFSIFVCCMAALLCFDLAGAMTFLLHDMYGGDSGNADISVNGQDFTLDMIAEKVDGSFPEYEAVAISRYSDKIYEDVEGEYYIASVSKSDVVGINLASASKMGLIEDTDLGDDEAIVTKRLAELYGCSEGEKIDLHNVKQEPYQVTVKKVVPDDGSYFYRGSTVIINENTAEALSCGRPATHIYMLDILDDEKVSEAKSLLLDAFPDLDVTETKRSAEAESEGEQIAGFMFLVFVIAFLLVIFITASICERIVSERMSYIGTLRSLGLSAKATGLILLIENVFYALMGSIPGVIIYSIVRTIMFNSMFTETRPDGTVIKSDYPDLSILLIIGTVIGAIVIECLIPLRAQLRALKVSIRDIIFDNRDTQYKFSKFGIITGIILAVLTVGLFFLRKNIFAAALCVICGVMATAFLFPLLLKKITSFIENHSRKADKERWALAAVEAGTRKSAVGSGVLSVTSAAMCVIVFSVAMSFAGLMESTVYDADVIVDTSSDSAHYNFVDHMDGVTDSELVYLGSENVTIGSEKLMIQLVGVPEGGYRMYNAFADVPDKIEDGQVVLEKSWADTRGYKTGDTLEMLIDPDGVFPIKKSFEVVGMFKNMTGLSGNDKFLVSMNEYKSLLHDSPGKLLIKSENPDETAEVIDKYAVTSCFDVKTKQELEADDKQSNATFIRVFGLVIIVALGMTCIGMISNQLIGFEGRRKECAVMLSTAMSQKTLIGILFREMLITAMTSATTGILVGSIMVIVIKAALAANPSLYLPVKVNPVLLISLWAGMTLVFALTVLFPIKHLRKMKISEQIKCE